MLTVMGSFILASIGIKHSPFQENRDAPRQGRFSDAECTNEILPEFTEGL
jgi:tRNA (Thr-GGU) A37 N-methylase